MKKNSAFDMKHANSSGYIDLHCDWFSMILVDDDDMEVREEQPSSHRLAKSMGVDARNMQVMKASFFMDEEAPSGLGMYLSCRVRPRQKRKCGSYRPRRQKTGHQGFKPGLKVIKLEYSPRLKIKRNDWLLADTCPQGANHCALF